MALIVKKGEIRHIAPATTSIGRNGNMNTKHSWSFRIDDFPAKLKSSNHTSLSDGDLITAVGEVRNGTLTVFAFRNETTGAYDDPPVVSSFLRGVVFILIGLPLCLIIIGFRPLLFGIKSMQAAFIGHNAKALLAAH